MPYGATHLSITGVVRVANGAFLNLGPDGGGNEAFRLHPGGEITVSDGAGLWSGRPFLNAGHIAASSGATVVVDGASVNLHGPGSATGPTVRMLGGTVTYQAGGALAVLASGGSARGTIAARQALEVAATGQQWASMSQDSSTTGPCACCHHSRRRAAASTSSSMAEATLTNSAAFVVASAPTEFQHPC